MKSELSLKFIELDKHENGRYEIETLYKKLLHEDPKNIEVWMRLAILYMGMPFGDDPLAFSCLEKVFEIDPHNIQATLLYAEFYQIRIPLYNEKIMNQLQALHTDSDELNSMIKYAMSWQYQYDDHEQQEKYLVDSVNLYAGHVWNRVYLAQLYTKKNKIIEAKILLEQALKNVVKVYDGSDDIDYTAVQEYFNEFITGTHITDILVNWIKRGAPE